MAKPNLLGTSCARLGDIDQENNRSSVAAVRLTSQDSSICSTVARSKVIKSVLESEDCFDYYATLD